MKKEYGKLLFAPWGASNKNYGSAQVSESIFREIFNEVLIFDPQEETYENEKEAMNKKFLSIVEKEKPNYIFLWLIYDEFFYDTIVKIKSVSPKTKIINFFGDDDTLYDNFSRYYATLFDCSLVFQKHFLEKYKKEGIENAFKLIGVDLNYYKPLGLDKKYDVSFIGTPKKDRYELLKFLIDNGIKVRIFGAGWQKHPDIKEFYGGKLSREDFVKAINQSKINLSFTKNYDGKLHYVGRISEIAACKSFPLSEYFDGYYNVFTKDELKSFKNKEELLEQVKYYLENEREREKITEKIYKRVTKEQSLKEEVLHALSQVKERSSNPVKSQREYEKNREKVVYLSEDDLDMNEEEIISRIKSYEYVGVMERETFNMKYKEYLQILSIKRTGKNISCCDYYAYTSLLGDYLTFNAKFAHSILDRREFFKLASTSQFLFDCKFFIKNLKEIKKDVKNFLFECEKKDISFISIPLVRKSSIIKKPSKDFRDVYLPRYEDKIRYLSRKRKLFTSPYIYSLLVRSLLKERFIAKDILMRIPKYAYLIAKR